MKLYVCTPSEIVRDTILDSSLVTTILSLNALDKVTEIDTKSLVVYVEPAIRSAAKSFPV